MNCSDFDRRRPFRPKPKPSRITRLGRILRKGRDGTKLRDELFDRAQGFCEDCGRSITRLTMDAHHVEKRSQGGSDTLENLKGLCRICHEKYHPGPQWHTTA